MLTKIPQILEILIKVTNILLKIFVRRKEVMTWTNQCNCFSCFYLSFFLWFYSLCLWYSYQLLIILFSRTLFKIWLNKWCNKKLWKSLNFQAAGTSKLVSCNQLCFFYFLFTIEKISNDVWSNWWIVVYLVLALSIKLVSSHWFDRYNM